MFWEMGNRSLRPPLLSPFLEGNATLRCHVGLFAPHIESSKSPSEITLKLHDAARAVTMGKAGHPDTVGEREKRGADLRVINYITASCGLNEPFMSNASFQCAAPCPGPSLRAIAHK